MIHSNKDTLLLNTNHSYSTALNTTLLPHYIVCHHQPDLSNFSLVVMGESSIMVGSDDVEENCFHILYMTKKMILMES